ncbi:hypothetical protein C2E21_6175 [Chlorella sorokiniana]|uniref:Uncharacterized protein n=1 Tax=Chlorella sorokiniana TaxID=3076 RepID=A0A2P6TLK8_CHLSO|nr:hypothetical protein C2E21_6175 [Chlorella sorokiniana]|eukprot:PRW45170.1 hypothetical protein C2E21_6175 [Chlorella sorokiniana]
MFNTEPGPNRPWMNTDPRLAPEQTGLYWEAKQPGGSVRPASAGASSHPHRLGAAVACGYGRAPTATLHTTAGAAVPTTALQSPQATRGSGRGRLQAFAFSPGGFLGHGSFLGGSTSASAPTSPLDRRTLLYTRTAAASTVSRAVAAGGWGAAQRQFPEPQPQEPLPQRLPAIDLLDRLALLRRLAPATDPAPRPPQLLGGSTAQPSNAHAAPAAGHQQPAPGGIKRWAWDDSLVSSGGQPLTAGPAPGWRFCGEVVEPLPEECLLDSTAAALVSTGGDQAALLVVRSPRQHRLCLGEVEEGEEGAQWHAADGMAGYGSRRAAFRPPGPLKHKFGNKPQPRPRSAPGGGDKAARVPGLRDCGCPKSPRTSGLPAAGAARRGGSGTARPQATAGSRRQLSWADTGLETAAASAPVRPRSAGLAVMTAAQLRPALRQRLPSGSSEAEHAIPDPAPASPRVVRSSGDGGSSHQGALRRQAVDVTRIEVTTDGDGATDVVVVSSPRAACGLDEEGEDELEVAVTSSPSHSGACSSEVVVMQQRAASRSPLLARPRQEPAAASVPAATRLTVSLPGDGRPSSYSIRADASTAAAGGSAGGSPVKAWRPAQRAQQQAQQAQQTTTTTTTVSVDVLTSPPQHQPGATSQRQQQQQVEQRQQQQVEQRQQLQQQPAAAADHLKQLAGEIRRREQSFNSLLAELEAIQQKCAKLSGPACAKASTAGAAPMGSGVGLPRPRSGRNAAAAGQAGATGGSNEKDWSWQSLMDFEATTREQQRKLVEQGVLPPDYL